MATYTQRDKEASREIHRLFRRAWMQDPFTLAIWVLTRPAAMFVYSIMIPFEVAYGLQAIITKQFDQVSSHAWMILVYAVIYCVLWGVGGVAICRNAKRSMIYVQRLVFANYLEKDYEFLNNIYLGSLGSQATRLREALDEYDQILFNRITGQAIIVIFSIGIIAYNSSMLALITIITMLITLSSTIVITKWRVKFRRELSETNSETAGVISDALGNAATVKSFAAEDYEQSRLNTSLNKLADSQYWSWMTSIPADIIRVALAAVATFLMLIFTSRLYQDGSITIAVVILVQLYVVKLVSATQEVANIIKAYESVMSVAHQAVKTMLIPTTIKDKPKTKQFSKSSQYGIELKKVTYRYADSPDLVAAVSNLSLNIKPGERVGLIGYSGSGKTTLTKLLLRFADVSDGGIEIAGIDVRDLKQKQLRSKIAYVPQEPLLFHRSIKDNIAYGKPGATKQELDSVMRAAYIDEFSRELNKGVSTLVGEKGVKLSGGQRQRVAIARALLKDAPILILDEATSALDSKSEMYIQKALWKLMQGRTALVIAHRLSTIQRMDRIVVMDKGKIVETGTHEELLSRGGVYAKLWQHQSGGYLLTEV